MTRNTWQYASMTEAQRAVERLRDKHGSLQKAARACGSTTATFSRILAGLVEPSEQTLELLGLVKHVTYRKPNGRSGK